MLIWGGAFTVTLRITGRRKQATRRFRLSSACMG